MASWPQLLGSMPNLRSFSLQPSLTHALKLPRPTTDSICANKASSKRIIFRVLPERSVLLFKFFPCIRSYHYNNLSFMGMTQFIGDGHNK
ncbi:Uncharacterised protein [Budvicia aquatica]|uniref:Uncharacterized protein n=1 Tax=Budvicia aquatica TaxID=82979 RepID=A0A484ZIY5_9GAMM|nr:Uncharacterised protein [Budvicia aquatica]